MESYLPKYNTVGCVKAYTHNEAKLAIFAKLFFFEIFLSEAVQIFLNVCPFSFMGTHQHYNVVFMKCTYGQGF